MDRLALSDTRATISLILQLFTAKLKQVVDARITEKYGFGLKDRRIMEKYPRPFEKDQRRFYRIGLKTLVDLINNDISLYVSSSDPFCMQVSYKLSAMVAFYYGVRSNDNYSLSEGIECATIAIGLVDSLKLDPKGNLRDKILREYNRFVKLSAEKKAKKKEVRVNETMQKKEITGLTLTLRPDLFEEPMVEDKKVFKRGWVNKVGKASPEEVKLDKSSPVNIHAILKPPEERKVVANPYNNKTFQPQLDPGNKSISNISNSFGSFNGSDDSVDPLQLPCQKGGLSTTCPISTHSKPAGLDCNLFIDNTCIDTSMRKNAKLS